MSASTRQSSTMDLAWALWLRRKWLAILTFCGCFFTLASLIQALPDLYRAETTILVEQELPDTANRPSNGDLELRLQAIHREVLSRTRLQSLIHRYELYPSLQRQAPVEAVIERMRRDIRFERQQAAEQWGRNATVAFTLSYQGWDPEIVAQVTNDLASFYVDQNERFRWREVAASRATSTAAQLSKKRQELLELRTRFSDLYPEVIRLQAEITALERYHHEGSGVGDQVNNGSVNPVSVETPPEAAAEPELQSTDAQFRVLDYAVAPHLPDAPNRVRMLLIGLMLSIGVTAVAILVVEQIDASFHQLEELRRFTGVPVLACVPRIATRADIWRNRLLFSGAFFLTVVVLLLVVHLAQVLGARGEALVWMLAGRGT